MTLGIRFATVIACGCLVFGLGWSTVSASTVVTASVVTDDSVVLSWPDVSDSVSYSVYDSSGAEVAQTSSPLAVLDGLSPNTSYDYSVVSESAQGVATQVGDASVVTEDWVIRVEQEALFVLIFVMAGLVSGLLSLVFARG